MTISELTADQMTELKQAYLTEHLLETEERTPSYNEIANADEIVPDWVIFEAYSGTIFSEYDFCCTGV